MGNKTIKDFLEEIHFDFNDENSEIKHNIAMETYAQQQSKIKSVEFAEWCMNNQFTMYNNTWTSIKIYYSGCQYTTSQLYDLYLEWLEKQNKLKFMEENGLGEKDMINDISPMHEI